MTLHLDTSIFELDLNLLDLDFHVAIIVKSRLPIPDGKVDRLVPTVLVAVDTTPFLEIQNFISGEVLRNDDILLSFEVLRKEDGTVKMTYPSGAGALYNFYSFS
jgi:hypothetical protein